VNSPHRAIDFVNFGRAVVDARPPTGVEGIGENHHAVAGHFGADGEAVWRVLRGGLPPHAAVEALLKREPRPESH